MPITYLIGYPARGTGASRWNQMEILPVDPKRIVEQGYDRIAERYAEWSRRVRDEARERYTCLLLDGLPPGAQVLELGCGSGLPTTRRLAERYRVTGVDLSARQIEMARRNVPGAIFIQADMTSLDLPSDSFDGVTAFYSITHIPREEHAPLLRSIERWLRPGGLFVATLGARAAEGGIEDDWLGAPMYFSHYDSETNKHFVREAGLEIIRAEEATADEDGTPVTFLWMLGRKPGHGTSGRASGYP